MSSNLIKLYPEPAYTDKNIEVTFTAGISSTCYSSGIRTECRRMHISNIFEEFIICAATYNNLSHFRYSKINFSYKIDVDFSFYYGKGDKKNDLITPAKGIAEIYVFAIPDKEEKKYRPLLFKKISDNLEVSLLYRFEFDMNCFSGEMQYIVY